MSSSFTSPQPIYCILLLLLSHLILITHPTASKCDHTSGGQLINGQDVSCYAWPQIASLLMIDPHSLAFSNFCGGTVWNGESILTAAHCVTNRNGTPIPLALIRVYLGPANISTLQVDLLFEISTVIPHPHFHPTVGTHDLAILQLTKPVISTGLNSQIKCACAPEPTLRLNKGECLTLGWGRLDRVNARVYPNWLQMVRLPLQPDTVCSSVAKARNYTDYNSSRTICAANYPAGGAGPCTDDSGGPLLCPLKEHPDVYSLVGILSQMAAPTMNCAEAKGAYFFTDIRAYTKEQWFLNATGEAGDEENPPSALRSLFNWALLVAGIIILLLLGSVFFTRSKEVEEKKKETPKIDDSKVASIRSKSESKSKYQAVAGTLKFKRSVD